MVIISYNTHSILSLSSCLCLQGQVTHLEPIVQTSAILHSHHNHFIIISYATSKCMEMHHHKTCVNKVTSSWYHVHQLWLSKHHHECSIGLHTLLHILIIMAYAYLSMSLFIPDHHGLHHNKVLHSSPRLKQPYPPTMVTYQKLTKSFRYTHTTVQANLSLYYCTIPLYTSFMSYHSDQLCLLLSTQRSTICYQVVSIQSSHKSCQ